MSVDASVSLRIVDVMSGVLVSPMKILEMLAVSQWSFVNQHGNAMYLPIGDRDSFNWQADKMDTKSLMMILSTKAQQGELIGVSLYWKDSSVGGSLLLWQEKEAEQEKIHAPFCFSLDSDRQILSGDYNCKITDVNWYLTKLLPVFNQGDSLVEYFTYREHK